MVPLTMNLRFLVAGRPGLSEPSMTARMAATLDRLSDGRVLINVVAGGDPVEMHGDGVWFDHGERYKATAEIPDRVAGADAGTKSRFQRWPCSRGGRQTALSANSKALPATVFRRFLRRWAGCGGGTLRRLPHLGERPTEIGEKLARAQQRAAERGRTLSFGIRLHVVVRETAEEAWREADALIQHVDDEAIALSQRTFARCAKPRPGHRDHQDRRIRAAKNASRT